MPTFGEAMTGGNFSEFRKILEKDLKSGTYGGSKLCAFGDKIKDIFTNDEGAHGNMNLDHNRGKGRESYNGLKSDGRTKHEAARNAAQRDLNKRQIQ